MSAERLAPKGVIQNEVGASSLRIEPSLPEPHALLFDRLDTLIASLPPERLPAVMAALSARLGLAAARVLAEAGSEDSAQSLDENLSVGEAARRLGVSEDYLYRHARRLPFTRRIGRRLLFSAKGLERWNARRRTA